jgi:hypothetical protein
LAAAVAVYAVREATAMEEAGTEATVVAIAMATRGVATPKEEDAADVVASPPAKSVVCMATMHRGATGASITQSSMVS